MEEERRSPNNYFDGLPLSGPQILIFLVLMAAYFFQQFSNWSFNFLVMAILKSSDLVGQTGNTAMARITWWYFLGMTLGGIAAGVVSDRFGRRPAMLGGLFVLSLATVVASLTRNLDMFIAARAMTGFGVFALMIASHAYIAEMAPAESRGKWQCRIAAVGFLAAPASALLSRVTLQFSPDAWRYVLAFGGLGIVPFFLGITCLKESPRWLVAKGRREEAEELVEELSGYGVRLPAEAERDSARPSGLADMLSRPYRKRTAALVILFVLSTPAQFICAFWFPQLFANVLTPAETASLMQYISYGVPVGCLLASFFTDLGGRKLPLAVALLSGGVVTCALFWGATYHAVFLFGFLVQVFSLSSSFTLFTYAAEQYPTRIRNAAAGVLNGLGRFAMSGFQPVIVLLLGGLGVRGVFLLAGGLYFLSVPLLLLWGRKTGGLPLEDAAAGEG